MIMSLEQLQEIHNLNDQIHELKIIMYELRKKRRVQIAAITSHKSGYFLRTEEGLQTIHIKLELFDSLINDVKGEIKYKKSLMKSLAPITKICYYVRHGNGFYRFTKYYMVLGYLEDGSHKPVKLLDSIK